MPDLNQAKIFVICLLGFFLAEATTWPVGAVCFVLFAPIWELLLRGHTSSSGFTLLPPFCVLVIITTGALLLALWWAKKTGPALNTVVTFSHIGTAVGVLSGISLLAFLFQSSASVSDLLFILAIAAGPIAYYLCVMRFLAPKE